MERQTSENRRLHADWALLIAYAATITAGVILKTEIPNLTQFQDLVLASGITVSTLAMIAIVPFGLLKTPQPSKP